MGCACHRQTIRCSTSPADSRHTCIHPTEPNFCEPEEKKLNKDSVKDCHVSTTITGKKLSACINKVIDCKVMSKGDRYSSLRNIDDTMLCHILNFAFSIKMVKNFIRAKRKSKDIVVPKIYSDQIKDFYNISTSMKKIHKIIYFMLSRPGHLNLANNNTFVVSKMFSFVGNEDESNQCYKKGRSLSPRSLLYTSKKLPDIKNFNNYATIKDIADDVDHEQHFVKRISKFKSFG